MSAPNEDGRKDEAAPDAPSDTTSTMSMPPSAGQYDTKGTGELTAEDASALEALPHGSALLLVQRGPSAGSRFLLDTEVVSAGPHPDSVIFLDDVTASRRHATFRRTPEGYRVSDAGS